MEKREIEIGDSLFDEFGNEYIVDRKYSSHGYFVERKTTKIVIGYVNIFYDTKHNQMTTGITYMDRESAERNGQSDPNYVKTIQIDNKEEGENKQ